MTPPNRGWLWAKALGPEAPARRGFHIKDSVVQHGRRQTECPADVLVLELRLLAAEFRAVGIRRERLEDSSDLDPRATDARSLIRPLGVDPCSLEGDGAGSEYLANA